MRKVITVEKPSVGVQSSPDLGVMLTVWDGDGPERVEFMLDFAEAMELAEKIENAFKEARREATA